MRASQDIGNNYLLRAIGHSGHESRDLAECGVLLRQTLIALPDVLVNTPLHLLGRKLEFVRDARRLIQQGRRHGEG